MIIDMHCHYVPDAVSELLRQRKTAPFIERLNDGSEIRHMPAGNKLSYSSDYTDMTGRVVLMDKLGIDHQMLSMGLLFGLHALPIEESTVIACAFNDDLHDLCTSHPDRFSGLALLPMADIDAAVQEYRRARQELDLIGAILPVNSFVDREEADKLRPIFETAQEIGGHIFVHPGVRPDEFLQLPGSNSDAAQRDNAMERMALNVQAKLGQAMVTLSFSDYLEPYVIGAWHEMVVWCQAPICNIPPSATPRVASMSRGVSEEGGALWRLKRRETMSAPGGILLQNSVHGKIAQH